MEIVFVSKAARMYKTYPDHCHKTWEIIYSTEGTGTAVIEGVEYPFKAGTIFCIPPESMHRKCAENGYRDDCIFLKGFVPVTTGVTVCEDDAEGSFYTLFRLLHATYTKKGSGYAEVSAALGLAMVEYLKSWCGDEVKRNSVVEEFQKILIDHLSDSDFKLSSEMEKTGYSINHFRKIFKECTGTTPLNYLEKVRIEHAKQQIRIQQNVLTLKEIAEISGFSDPYYFSRVFHKCEGMSPSIFLKKAVRDNDMNVSLNRIGTSYI